MENNSIFTTAALQDLKREREILTNELLSAKDSFANDMKDVLGEQIKKELSKSKKIVEEKPVVKEKKGIFTKILDALSKTI